MRSRRIRTAAEPTSWLKLGTLAVALAVTLPIAQHFSPAASAADPWRMCYMPMEREYDEPFDRVWVASIQALAELGYRVRLKEVDRGLILTYFDVVSREKVTKELYDRAGFLRKAALWLPSKSCKVAALVHVKDHGPEGASVLVWILSVHSEGEVIDKTASTWVEEDNGIEAAFYESIFQTIDAKLTGA